MEKDNARRHAWISGGVQGVWFRQSTFDEATRAGVTGWVRNLPDGRVEAVFEGSAKAVDAILAWCHQGPASANVTDVRIEDEEPQGLRQFEVRG